MKGKQQDPEQHAEEAQATQHYSPEKQAVEPEAKKKGRKPRATADQNKKPIENASATTPPPKRRRQSSEPQEKLTFARRYEPELEPNKTVWKVAKRIFESEIVGKVRAPSSLEDRHFPCAYQLQIRTCFQNPVES